MVTGPDFNVRLYNGSTGLGQAGNVLITSVGGSNTVSFTVQSPTNANVFAYNAVFYDEGTTQAATFSSSPVVDTISSPLTFRVAFSPDGTIAYAVNEGTPGIVNVIDVATNSVINTITVGSTPTGVAFTANGALAYVVNDGSSSVSVINVSTNTIVNTITVTGGPVSVAFNPAGTLAYIGKVSLNTVSVINVATNTVVSTIIVGSAPEVVAITPDGTLGYVTNTGSSTVSVFNVASNSVINTLTVGSNPQDVAFTPDGTLAYITNVGSGTVNVINVATNVIINTITLQSSPQGVVFNPAGTLAFITNRGSATMSVVKVATNSVIGTIPVGADPYYLAINPNGTITYVPNHFGLNISVISNNFAITVNTPITTPTISPTTPTIYDVGQNITVSAYESGGGTGPYTYNFSIFNISNTLVANQLGSSNSFTWTITPLQGSNVLYANVVVIDNSGATANSINSAPVTVNNQPIFTITPSNQIIDSGQTETYTFNIINGTGPSFNSELFDLTGQSQVQSNVIITNLGASNTISFQVSSPTSSNVFEYIGNTFDSGTTLPYAFHSSPSVINSVSAFEPWALAFTPDGTLAYVVGTNGQGSVNVISVATNTVVNTIASSGQGRGIVINSAGTLAYVASAGGTIATVNVISLATNTLVKTIPITGSGATSLALSPDGSLIYAVSDSSGTGVSVINTATNTVIAHIGIGGNPIGVAFTPDGGEAYVTAFFDSISVINVATNTITTSITMQNGGEAIAFNHPAPLRMQQMPLTIM